MFCCRLFGSTGYCSACSKVIPAFEMVMRAKGNVYHLECFACQQCNHRSVLTHNSTIIITLSFNILFLPVTFFLNAQKL